jgi:hypothetical protein
MIDFEVNSAEIYVRRHTKCLFRRCILEKIRGPAKLLWTASFSIPVGITLQRFNYCSLKEIADILSGAHLRGPCRVCLHSGVGRTTPTPPRDARPKSSQAQIQCSRGRRVEPNTTRDMCLSCILWCCSIAGEGPTGNARLHPGQEKTRSV